MLTSIIYGKHVLLDYGQGKNRSGIMPVVLSFSLSLYRIPAQAPTKAVMQNYIYRLLTLKRRSSYEGFFFQVG